MENKSEPVNLFKLAEDELRDKNIISAAEFCYSNCLELKNAIMSIFTESDYNNVNLHLSTGKNYDEFVSSLQQRTIEEKPIAISMMYNAIKEMPKIMGILNPLTTLVRQCLNTSLNTADLKTPLQNYLVDYSVGIINDKPRIFRIARPGSNDFYEHAMMQNEANCGMSAIFCLFYLFYGYLMINGNLALAKEYRYQFADF